MNTFVRQDQLIAGDIFVDEDGHINTVVSPFKEGVLEFINGSYRDHEIALFAKKRVVKQARAAEFPVMLLFRRS